MATPNEPARAPTPVPCKSDLPGGISMDEIDPGGDDKGVPRAAAGCRYSDLNNCIRSTDDARRAGM